MNNKFRKMSELVWMVESEVVTADIKKEGSAVGRNKYL